MPEPVRQQQPFIEYGWKAFKDKARGMAAQYSPTSNVTELSRDEQRRLFATRTMPVEQEAELWRQGKTPEEIGFLSHKHREKLAKSGGRIEPKDWIAYINDLAAEVDEMQKDGRMPPPERYTTLEIAPTTATSEPMMSAPDPSQMPPGGT